MRRILLVFVILSSCTFGVDGDETVSTGEALQELKLAALSNVLCCHPFQGNIMTGFDGRPGFWFSCL